MYYTKYRPQNFSEILKPNETVDVLVQQIKSGKTVHAYLFTGPKGTGKTTVARILAKALNCENLSKAGDICGTCLACRAITKGNFMDLMEIDAASNRGIDDIRDLKEKIKLLPTQGRKKVYIIDEVHMLTSEAFNALLKTLEEPPKHATFILCTTELHKVPETIKSRCQVFKFKRPTREQLVEKLKRIQDAESPELKLSRDILDKVAMLAGGAFRDAETILQQVIEGGLDAGALKHDFGMYADFIRALGEDDPGSAVKLLNTCFRDGDDLTLWVEGLLKYFRDVMYLKMGFSPEYFSLTEETLKQMLGLAGQLSLESLITYIEMFNQAQNDLKTFSIPQLALEVAVAKSVGASAIGKGNVPSKGDKPKTGGGKEEITSKNITDDSASSSVAPSADLGEVGERWAQVVAEVLVVNSSVSALLKSGKPVGIGGNAVILEVSYKFHKERLESTLNRKMVENALEKVFAKRLTIKCVLGERKESHKAGVVENLTDLNIRVPQNVIIDSNAAVSDIFDGGLPL